MDPIPQFFIDPKTAKDADRAVKALEKIAGLDWRPMSQLALNMSGGYLNINDEESSFIRRFLISNSQIDLEKAGYLLDKYEESEEYLDIIEGWQENLPDDATNEQIYRAFEKGLLEGLDALGKKDAAETGKKVSPTTAKEKNLIAEIETNERLAQDYGQAYVDEPDKYYPQQWGESSKEDVIDRISKDMAQAHLDDKYSIYNIHPEFKGLTPAEAYELDKKEWIKRSKRYRDIYLKQAAGYKKELAALRKGPKYTFKKAPEDVVDTALNIASEDPIKYALLMTKTKFKHFKPDSAHKQALKDYYDLQESFKYYNEHKDEFKDTPLAENDSEWKLLDKQRKNLLKEQGDLYKERNAEWKKHNPNWGKEGVAEVETDKYKELEAKLVVSRSKSQKMLFKQFDIEGRFREKKDKKVPYDWGNWAAFLKQSGDSLTWDEDGNIVVEPSAREMAFADYATDIMINGDLSQELTPEAEKELGEKISGEFLQANIKGLKGSPFERGLRGAFDLGEPKYTFKKPAPFKSAAISKKSGIIRHWIEMNIHTGDICLKVLKRNMTIVRLPISICVMAK
jgi:hypothetical protein